MLTTTLNDSMRHFIDHELYDLFSSFVFIQSKKEYMDADNQLAIDVYAKVGYSEISPIICYKFRIGNNFTPMILMSDNSAAFAEPTKEYIYIFAMLKVEELYRDLREYK